MDVLTKDGKCTNCGLTIRGYHHVAVDQCVTNLRVRLNQLEAALSRYREAVEDVSGIARVMIDVEIDGPVDVSIVARAVQDYIRRRAGEGE